ALAPCQASSCWRPPQGEADHWPAPVSRVNSSEMFCSRRKSEMHDVAVGDDVRLALEPHLARLLRAALAAERHIIVVGDGLGADEAALEVGMDDAGRLRRPGAARDRPGRRLLGAGGEIGDQIE